MRYTLMLENPKDFYNEVHRTIHFLDFANTGDPSTAVQQHASGTEQQEQTGADREDLFA